MSDLDIKVEIPAEVTEFFSRAVEKGKLTINGKVFMRVEPCLYCSKQYDKEYDPFDCPMKCKAGWVMAND